LEDEQYPGTLIVFDSRHLLVSDKSFGLN